MLSDGIMQVARERTRFRQKSINKDSSELNALTLNKPKLVRFNANRKFVGRI